MTSIARIGGESVLARKGTELKRTYLGQFSTSTTRDLLTDRNMGRRLEKIEQLLLQLHKRKETNLEGKIDNSNDGQARFKQFKYQFENINGLPEIQRTQKIKIFASDLLRKVLSKGFTWFQEGKLTDHKLRHFFCNNFIANLCNYAYQNKLSQYQLQQLDNHLKQNTIPFVKLRYPQNQSLETNQQFNKLVVPVDNFQSNENDLIHQSKVKFNLKHNGDYSQQIMKFINFLLGLTRQIRKQQGKEGANLYTLFCQQMQDIFHRVQSQKWVIMMSNQQFKEAQQFLQKQNEPKDPKILSEPSFIEQEVKKQKYKKQVKQYTKFLIGQKLSNNVQLFTDKEIQEQNLSVSNPGVMRILTKWCEDLQKNFDQANINSRDERFRMEDGCQRYIKKQQRKTLAEILQRTNQQRVKFVEQVKDNIYQNQYHMLKDGSCLNAFRDFASEGEGITGYFATVMKKSNENYLISYLNKLIHCILVAQQQFKNLFPKKDHYKSAVNMISFRVGDLLRCKFSSKQRQIIALYTYLKTYCSIPSNKKKLDLVRVKNRLNEGTKDILINFRFRQTLLVQMQLSINQQSSTFIKCSDKVNHFVYELERATFGPISEMCNVYRTNDPRAQFFNKVFQSLNDQNQYKPAKNQKNRSQLSKEYTSLPVWCDQCGKFVSNLNMFIKHIKYKQDGIKKFRCSSCIIRNNQIAQIRIQNKVLQLKYQSLIKSKHTSLIKKKVIVVDLCRKKKQQASIFIVYYNSKLMLFQDSKLKGGLTCIGTVKNQSELDKILMDFSILKEVELDASEQDQIKECINLQIMKGQINEIKKKMKKSFFFEDFGINQGMLNNQLLESVELINLTKNNFQTLQNLTETFPNAHIVFLSKNKITQIKGVSGWKQVRQLSLEGNQLTSIPQQIKQLKELEFILLTNNNFKEFPEELCQLSHLRALNFKGNAVVNISDRISNMKGLRIFRMTGNLIEKIPPALCQLDQLEQIDLGNNKLETLPIQLSKMKGLKQLKLPQNNFKNLPQEAFKNLQNLKNVDFSKNSIAKLPVSLAGKPNLKKLNSMKNKLEQIPKFIFDLPALQDLNLTQNQIKAFAPGSQFKNCKLKNLNLNKNNIKEIPAQLFNILSIEKLNIGENLIKDVPFDGISRLVNLKQLVLNKLQIKQFPKEIVHLNSLQLLNLQQNQIARLSSQIVHLAALKELNLSMNKLDKFPSELFLLRSLQTLYLRNNQIKEIPPGIKDMPQLRKIALNNNLISDVPKQVFGMKKLKVLLITIKMIKNINQLSLNSKVSIIEEEKSKKKDDDD